MERGALARWVLWGLAAFFLVTFVFPRACGRGGDGSEQPLYAEGQRETPGAGAERLCDLWGDQFRAQISTRGASVRHFYLTSAKYTKKGQPIDLATTPDQPYYQQLRVDFRNLLDPKAPNAQVDYDLIDWKLRRADGKVCEFAYQDDKVELAKTVSLTGRPYELEVKARIVNRSDRRLAHAVTAHVATWRTNDEVAGKMFRVSPFVTNVECIPKQGSAVRKRPDDFKPESFKKEAEFRATPTQLGDWYQVSGAPDVAAVSNAYFTQAIVPARGPAEPACQLQIEYRGDRKAPGTGAFYRARLAYPRVELGPGESREYVVLGYAGPKERNSLALAGGGQHRLGDLIDLGFFSAIAKVLVSFLLGVYRVIPNWGIAIITLTVTARILLFPLTIPSIKSMVKMRELQPEIDALNAKFKDDPQQKGLAQMELWRKHNVNPLKGCLPQFASMPVWFALYTTLQTAVELYNIPFLWFPDLSGPDPYYVLPFIIGGTSFIQQRMMPMTGGDPAQQKMMLYFMPLMFTAFMLFLPSGLGVYMFTNGLLGILQQQVVQRQLKRRSSAPAAVAEAKAPSAGRRGGSQTKGGAGGPQAPAKI
jgi:YidC/Oxa1 family membrane protein insertase